MATYTTLEEVKAEFKSLDTTSPGVTMTDVKIDRFREEAFALINAKIGNKYKTPIDAAAGCHAIVKMVELWLVKHRIQSIIPVRTGAEGAKQNERPENLKKMAEEMLEEIVSGKLKMEGATLTTSGDGVSSFNVSQGTEHTVKKDGDQW